MEDNYLKIKTTDEILARFNDLAYTRMGSSHLYDKESVKIAMKMYLIEYLEENRRYYDNMLTVEDMLDHINNKNILQ